MPITLFKDVQLSLFEFSNVHANSSRNSVFINYNGKQKLTLQTPVLTVPFGCSCYKPDKGDLKYSIDTSFKGRLEDTNIETFYQLMLAMDHMLITEATNRSREWFLKPMDRSVVENLYRPLVKQSKSPEKYEATTKFKIKDINTVECFLHTDRSRYNIEELPKGSKIQLIVELAPVWFVNKTFGLSFTILQAKVFPAPSRIQGFAFQSDNEDNEDNENIS